MAWTLTTPKCIGQSDFVGHQTLRSVQLVSAAASFADRKADKGVRRNCSFPARYTYTYVYIYIILTKAMQNLEQMCGVMHEIKNLQMHNSAEEKSHCETNSDVRNVITHEILQKNTCSARATLGEYKPSHNSPRPPTGRKTDWYG